MCGQASNLSKLPASLFWGKWGGCTWNFWSLLCTTCLIEIAMLGAKASQEVNALSITKPIKYFPLNISTENITLLEDVCGNNMTGERSAVLVPLLDVCLLPPSAPLACSTPWVGITICPSIFWSYWQSIWVVQGASLPLADPGNCTLGRHLCASMEQGWRRGGCASSEV